MNMVDTLKGSYFSEVLPEGWDISKIYDCVSNDPSSVGERQSFWNDGFRPVECTNLEEFGAYMVTKLPCRSGSPRKRAES
jgi:glucosamine-6-phosphate deaminase